MDAVQYFKRAPAASVPQIVGAAPWTYTNASAGVQVMTVGGGVVTLIEVDTGLGFLPAIGIAGVFVLFPQQAMRVTYVVSAPTVGMVQL